MTQLHALCIKFYFCSSAMKKTESDAIKKLESKEEELQKTKSEFKILKDSVTEKERLMQGKCLIFFFKF